jgi:hypothetical protein
MDDLAIGGTGELRVPESARLVADRGHVGSVCRQDGMDLEKRLRDLVMPGFSISSSRPGYSYPGAAAETTTRSR